MINRAGPPPHGNTRAAAPPLRHSAERLKVACAQIKKSLLFLQLKMTCHPNLVQIVQRATDVST